MSISLHGYYYSVYVRIARLVLEEKGQAYERVEVNPFSHDVPAAYLALHPFGRVPTLVHDGFAIYETGAITRYIDRAFPGGPLQPHDVRALARMDQIISVGDSYAYWPLVRQVFSQRVFRPRLGHPSDDGEVARGLGDASKVLTALESLGRFEPFMVGPDISLADLHLGAMVAYFAAAPEGAEMLKTHPKLSSWWDALHVRPSFAATEPGLPVTQV